MGDWKSSAIGGSDAKVMKSGVSKCTCLRSYRGGKRTGLINQIFIWSVLCDPMWSTGTRLFCTPRFYSSGSVNQKVEPEPFTESTPIASFKLSMMVLLIVFRNILNMKIQIAEYLYLLFEENIQMEQFIIHIDLSEVALSG